MDTVPDKERDFKGEAYQLHWGKETEEENNKSNLMMDVLNALDQVRKERDDYKQKSETYKRNWSLNARTARECLKNRFSIDEIEEAFEEYWDCFNDSGFGQFKEHLIRYLSKGGK